MDVLVKERTGAVLRLTLNRPQSRNALSLDLLHALADAVRAAEVDGSTRVVVLQGAPPAFSAGHDLSEIRAHMNDADHGRAFNERLFRTCSDLMLAIRRSPCPSSPPSTASRRRPAASSSLPATSPSRAKAPGSA